MAKTNIVTGLDIGSGTIKLVSGFKKLSSPQSNKTREEEENIEILTKVEEVSFGVRRGIVVDVNKVSQIIAYLVEKSQEDCGKQIKEVIASVGGSHIFSRNCHGLVSVSRADQKISEEDIDRVLQAAQTFSLPSNKEILDVLPKEFIVDGEGGVKDPLGMQGIRLEVDAVAIVGFSPYLKNSNQAILNAGISRIIGLVPNPLASARAVLTSREKELGVVLLDIGAGTTNLAVFKEGNLIHLAILPIGSGHITNDIAVCLKTDIDTAEKIKLQFGACFQEKKNKKKTRKKEQIKIKGERPEESLTFTPKTLSQIIGARVEEILGEAQKELKKLGKIELPGGVVLTGGGAKMPKLKDFCKKYLKLPSRVGAPRGFSPKIDDPAFSTACGLLLEGLDSIEEESPSRIKGVWNQLKKFLREFVP